MSTGISRTAARYQNVDTSNATNLNRSRPMTDTNTTRWSPT